MSNAYATEKGEADTQRKTIHAAPKIARQTKTASGVMAMLVPPVVNSRCDELHRPRRSPDQHHQPREIDRIACSDEPARLRAVRRRDNDGRTATDRREAVRDRCTVYRRCIDDVAHFALTNEGADMRRRGSSRSSRRRVVADRADLIAHSATPAPWRARRTRAELLGITGPCA